jgi:type VII secretion protein EssB
MDNTNKSIVKRIDDTILRCYVRNSELAVSKEKRALLTYPTDGLASSVLVETEDGIELQFDTTGLDPAKKILSKTPEEKYRFLINVADLVKLNTEFEVLLSLDNLLLDINLRPQLLMRDAKHENGLTFIAKYMALIGSIIQPKYIYEDYLNGGKDLYKKHKVLSKIVAFDSVSEIKEFLTNKYRDTLAQVQMTKRQISNKYVLITSITIPVLVVALVIAGFFLWTAFFQNIPFQNDVINANSAFIAGEYIEVQRTLNRYDISKLSFETRYILSRAYVITEALTNVQQDNILMGLTLRTEPIIFDYWILLGRLQFDEAIDIAQRLGDDEMLLFAYIKYEVVVRNDTAMSGDEKTELLGSITSTIERLQRERSEAENNVTE